MEAEINILIVDPDRTYPALLRRMLTPFYPDNLPTAKKVVIAHDGESALGILKNEPFDLLITELVFHKDDPPPAGKLDGYAFMNEVRAQYPNLRVIALTGHIMKMEQAIRAKVERFLFKGDDLAKIAGAIFRHVFS